MSCLRGAGLNIDLLDNTNAYAVHTLHRMDVDHILKMIVEIVERTVNFLTETVIGYYTQVILISNIN